MALKLDSSNYDYKFLYKVNRSIINSVYGLVIGLFLASLLLITTGESPISVFTEFLHGSVSSRENLLLTIDRMSPLLILGSAWLIASSVGTLNIGFIGQLALGAVASTTATIFLPFSGFGNIILSIFCGFMGGAVWALIPGLLKYHFNANEILTTLMLSSIGTYFLSWVVGGPLRKEGSVTAVSEQLSISNRLPNFFGTSVDIGLLISISLLILVGIYLKKSKLGLTARFIRTNPENETLSRINIPAYQCLGLTLSGGISGLAGSMLIFGGPTFTLSDGVGAREGLDGIVVALLAQGSITGIFLSAALIAITQRGAAWASVTIGLSKDSGYMIQGILVISMAATFNSNFVNKTNKLLIQIKKRCGSSNEPV